jgi:predicted membrane channel-forming protein YqfA (hemolysin III family)
VSADNNYWCHGPNKAAPIVFIVLFSISGILHAYQATKFRSWRYSFMLTWSAVEYIAGFIVREIAAYHKDSLGLLIAFSVLVMLAAPLYAAADYLILGRTLYYIPYLSPIHPGRVISTFIGLDIVIGILIGNGASKLVNVSNPKELSLGAALVKTAVIMQLVCFIGFVIIAAVFHTRARRNSVANRRVSTVLYALYASSGLIMLRSIFRIVEFFQGNSGSITTHEAYFYGFDATPMLINAFLWNFFHPGRFLPKNNKIYLAKDGVTEIEGPGWVDSRNFVMTIIDPFDIGGLIKGRDKQTAFWDQAEQLQTDQGGVRGAGYSNDIPLRDANDHKQQRGTGVYDGL